MKVTKTILRLNFILWRRSFFSNLPLVLNAGLLLFFGIMATLLLGIFSYDSLTENGDPSGFIITFAFGMIAYLLYGFLFPGGESSLDIRSFSPLPLNARTILPAYTVCALFQSRGFVALINTVIMTIFGVTALYSRGEIILGLMWVPVCIAQLAMTILIGEAVSSLFESKGSRFQEKMGMITGLLFFGVILAFYFVPTLMLNSSESTSEGGESSPEGDGTHYIGALADTMQWTPFGSIPSAIFAPTDMGKGSLLLCIAIILLSFAYAGIAIRMWYGFIVHALTQPLAGSHHKARSSKNSSLLFSWTPPTPSGAILARVLRYWRRDSRFTYALILMLVFPFLYVLLGITGAGEAYMWLSFLLLGLFLLTFSGNHYGYDGPANWVHCASGVSARSMVWTRALSVVIAWFLSFLILAVIIGIMKGFNALWFISVVIGASVGLTMIGLGSYFSVKFPYPTPAPGTNIFRAKNSAGAVGFLTVIIGMFFGGVAIVPVIVVIAFTFSEIMTSSILDIPLPVWGVVFLSICSGALVLCIGNWLAARNLNRQWPAIMEKVQHHT